MQMQKKLKTMALFFLIFSIVSCTVNPVRVIYADEEDEETQEDSETEETVTTQTDTTDSTQSKKTKISTTSIKIPIYEAVPSQLSVVNPKEGVTYYFASGNKKIVSVGKTTGILTGKKTGTTLVSLIKKGKKKNKVVGMCKVKVCAAKITKKNKKVSASIGGTITPVVSYKNARAKYTYKSSNQKVVRIGEKIEYTGATSLIISAESKGTANITVTEKYKKKKRVVGQIAVTVRKVTLVTKSISMVKGQSLKISGVVTVKYQDASKEVSYDYESADTSILTIDGSKMVANKVTAGTTLTVYQTIDGERSKLGTVTVIIAEANDKTPEASADSTYIDLSDYNNDYEEGFDEYDDNDYYPTGSDYIEDETVDSDDSYEDYENYLDDPEHSW